MSSLLYSTGNQTLAVAVLNSQQLGDIGTTAALSVLLTALTLLAALPVWLVLRLATRYRAGPPLIERAPRGVPEVVGAH